MTIKKIYDDNGLKIQQTPYTCGPASILNVLSLKGRLDFTNQGEGNLTARSIQIYEDQPLNETAFKNLIKAVASNNRAGGWRKLK